MIKEVRCAMDRPMIRIEGHRRGLVESLLKQVLGSFEGTPRTAEAITSNGNSGVFLLPVETPGDAVKYAGYVAITGGASSEVTACKECKYLTHSFDDDYRCKAVKGGHSYHVDGRWGGPHVREVNKDGHCKYFKGKRVRA